MNHAPRKKMRIDNKKWGISLALLFALVLLIVAPGGSVLRGNVFLGILLLAAAYPLTRLAHRSLRQLGFQKQDYFALLLLTIALCAVGALFLILFFRAEQDIKIYDFSNYWIRVNSDRERIAQSIPGYLSFLRDTFSQEYSHLAVFPLIPFSYLFGVSFTGYCLSVFIVYYVPSCLFLVLYALRILASFQKQRTRVYEWGICLALCIACPVFMRPVLLGYLDVCGVLVMAVLLNSALRWDTLCFSWKRSVAMAALSLTLILARRWYAYFIAGLYVALGAVSLVRMFHTKNKLSWAKLSALAANYAVVAGTACLGIVLLNPAIFSLFLGTNYAAVYAAFKGNGVLRSLWYLARHMGLLWMTAAFLGFVLLLQTKETRLEGIQLMSAAGIGAVLFLTVQDMGPHHEYLVIPALLVLVVAFVVFMLRKLSRADASLACTVIALAVLLNAGCAFFPGLGGVAGFASPLTTSLLAYPVRLANYDAYHRIHQDLGGRGDGGAASVYVVGEGEVLNPEYLRRINMPETEDATPYISVNNTVDLRDGFPSQFFMADRILVAEPFATDFTQTQQVSYQVYDLLRGDPATPAYYELEEVYPLEAHKALLYRRLRPVSRALVDNLKERLAAYYPADPFVYEPNYFLALMDCDETLVEYTSWENSLHFQQSAEAPAAFTLHDTGSFSNLQFDILCREPGMELVIENQGGEIYRAVLQGGTTAHQLDIAGSQYLSVSVRGAQDGVVTVYYSANSLW